jgi:hypothetical protein
MVILSSTPPKDGIMPKVLEDRVKALMGKGMPEAKAYAIGTASLQKQGKLPVAKAKKKSKK